VGLKLGVAVGLKLGDSVGLKLGDAEGLKEGAAEVVGAGVVGLELGDAEGEAVGEGVPRQKSQAAQAKDDQAHFSDQGCLF
jgi:hypothetical protein